MLTFHASGDSKGLDWALNKKFPESIRNLYEWFPDGKLPELKIKARMGVWWLEGHLDLSVVATLAQEELISDESPAEDWKMIERYWIRLLHHLDREALQFILEHGKNLDRYQGVQGTISGDLKKVPSKRKAVESALGCESSLKN